MCWGRVSLSLCVPPFYLPSMLSFWPLHVCSAGPFFSSRNATMYNVWGRGLAYPIWPSNATPIQRNCDLPEKGIKDCHCPTSIWFFLLSFWPEIRNASFGIMVKESYQMQRVRFHFNSTKNLPKKMLMFRNWKQTKKKSPRIISWIEFEFEGDVFVHSPRWLIDGLGSNYKIKWDDPLEDCFLGLSNCPSLVL